MLFRSPSPSAYLPLVAACALATGCLATPSLDGVLAPGDDRAVEVLERKGPRPMARTLPLEVFFLRCDADDGSGSADLWSRVDEQMIDVATRRRLAANGLRAGILLGPLPEPFLATLEPPISAGDDAVDPAVNAADATPPVVRRVLRLLPGRESELVSLKSAPELVVMERDDEGLRGASYHDALPHFTLRAWPAADGRVRVDLVPVIRHGPLERNFVGEDGAFKLETSQRRKILDTLRCDVTVPAEGLLVVGPAGEPGASVGDALFRPTRHGRQELRLIALRPLTPGVDPMFSPEESSDDPAAAASSEG